MDDNPRTIPQLPLALSAPPDQRLARYLQAPVGLAAQLRALAAGAADALFLHGGHATGNASSMPRKPNRVPPAITAKITAIGCRPMRSPTSFGVSQ